MAYARDRAPGVQRRRLTMIGCGVMVLASAGAAADPRTVAPGPSVGADLLGTPAGYVLVGIVVVQLVAIWLLCRKLYRQTSAEEKMRGEEANGLEKRILAEIEKSREQDRNMLQQSRFSAMGEMIGNIAHQWRQPLNMLGLLIQQMQMEQEKGVMTDALMEERVAKGMELILSLSATIDDFRNFYRPQLEAAPFKLDHVVTRTVNFFKPSCEDQNIKVIIDGKSDVVMNGHANEFSQALLNILCNARDAIVEKVPAQPRITVSMHDESQHSVVTVTDNGGGIDEKIFDKIFDPYFTTKEEGKGTGVGLYMARSIIRRSMRGELSAANVAEGAEFKIVI